MLTALGATTVPVGGCIEFGRGGPEDVVREVSIASSDDVPSGVPLEPSVEVIRSSVGSERTARIRATATNVAGRPIWSLVSIPVFGDFVAEGAETGRRLLLVPPDEDYETVRPGCWRVDLGEREVNWVYTDVMAPVRYEADETRTVAFDVYGHPENTGQCLPPGTYRVENRYSVGDDRAALPGDPDWQFRWGFTITVESPAVREERTLS